MCVKTPWTSAFRQHRARMSNSQLPCELKSVYQLNVQLPPSACRHLREAPLTKESRTGAVPSSPPPVPSSSKPQGHELAQSPALRMGQQMQQGAIAQQRVLVDPGKARRRRHPRFNSLKTLRMLGKQPQTRLLLGTAPPSLLCPLPIANGRNQLAMRVA